MITFRLKQNQLKSNPACYGKWYAHAVAEETVDLGGLADHMASHNSPFSAGTIKGMLTDMVACIKELLLDGKKVRIDDLAIFFVGIKNKKGCADKSTYKVSEFVEAVQLKSLAIGEFATANLKLEATLKRSSLDKDVASDDDADTDDTESGDSAGTDTGGTGGSGTTAGGTTAGGGAGGSDDNLEDAIG